MSEHFNRLSPAEAERLALLAEELGEAQQAIGKILRHGYASHHPLYPDGPDNRESLEREVGDVYVALRLMFDAGDLRRLAVARREDVKLQALPRYLHHQGPHK